VVYRDFWLDQRGGAAGGGPGPRGSRDRVPAGREETLRWLKEDSDYQPPRPGSEVPSSRAGVLRWLREDETVSRTAPPRG